MKRYILVRMKVENESNSNFVRNRFLQMKDLFLHPERDPQRIINQCGRVKLHEIENFIALSGNSDLWTCVIFPQDIAPFYLVSNRGRLICYRDSCFIVTRHNAGKNAGKVTLRVQRAKNKWSSKNEAEVSQRIYQPQLLFLLNFCYLPPELIRDLSEYRLFQIDDDRHCFDLDQLYLIRKAGRRNKYTLRDVFRIRNAGRSVKVQEWADSLGVQTKTIRSILNYETWQIASGKLAPVPYETVRIN